MCCQLFDMIKSLIETIELEKYLKLVPQTSSEETECLFQIILEIEQQIKQKTHRAKHETKNKNKQRNNTSQEYAQM